MSGRLSPNVNLAVTNGVELPDKSVKPVLTDSFNNGTLMLS